MSFRTKRRAHRFYSELFFWISTVVIAVLVSFFIITFVGERTGVSGHSMEPTLKDRDSVLVDKLTYRFRDPKRFEVVVFPNPTDRKETLVKRVIGLPGETVEIRSEDVYINGRRVSHDYSKDHMTFPINVEASITLKKDEYFVLGDNRNNSMDSRDIRVGPIYRKEIKGRVIFRLFPLKHMRMIR